MTFFSSFLPGFREIRGPVVGGYLWLLFIWLLADLPPGTSGDEDLYKQVVSLVEGIGPFGQAVAASVAAYLIGSVTSAIGLWIATTAEEALNFRLAVRGGGGPDEVWELRTQNEGWSPVEVIAIIAGATFEDFEWADPEADATLAQSVIEFTQSQIDAPMAELEKAVENVETAAGDGHPTFLLIRRNGRPIARLRESQASGATIMKDFPIPLIELGSDLIKPLSLIHTRLAELVPMTGQKIERIESEADFRLSVVAPLTALVILFASGASLVWLSALVLPLALLIDGFGLRRERRRELVDALRARSGDELEKLTPVFARFSREAAALSDGLRAADWRHTPSADRVVRPENYR